MKIIIGLGNPGSQYRHTRHNAGFMVLDRLAGRLNTAFTLEKYGGLIAQASYEDQGLLLVKPLMYMNNSGDCVARIVRYRPVDLAEVLVVVDDVNLPLGRLRFRPGGSAGGHNGLKSIVERLGTTEFPRLRLGVGQSGRANDLVDYVLGSFTPEEFAVRDEMVASAVEAVLGFVSAGIVPAMNRFNLEKGSKNSGVRSQESGVGSENGSRRPTGSQAIRPSGS